MRPMLAEPTSRRLFVLVSAHSMLSVNLFGSCWTKASEEYWFDIVLSLWEKAASIKGSWASWLSLC